MRKIIVFILLALGLSAYGQREIPSKSYVDQEKQVLLDSIAVLRAVIASNADAVAPTVSSASLNATGDSITVTMSENLLTDSAAAKSAFTLTVNDVTQTITSVAYATKYIYIVTSTIYSSDVVYISYTKPSSNTLEDAYNNEVASFNYQSVTNNSTQNSDVTPPVISFNAVYNSDRDAIYYDVTEPISITTAGWTLAADSGSVTVSSVDSANKYFTVSRDFEYGETITITYSPMVGATQDAAGNELDSLTRSVSNYIQQSVASAESDTLFVTERAGDTHPDGWLIFEYDSGEGDTIATDWEGNLPSGDPQAYLWWTDVDFYDTDSIKIRYAKPSNTSAGLYLRLDDPITGTTIADMSSIASTGGADDWDTYASLDVALSTTVNGTYDLYAVASNWNAVDLHYIIVTVSSSGAVDSTDIGNDWYFSQSGNDSNAGTLASPYKTISKLNSIIPNLQAGDSVFFNRGDVWNEAEITIDGIAGTAGNSIVFTAYGTGADPVITGGKAFDGLFTQSGNYWTYAYTGYTKGTHVHNTAGILIDGTFHGVAREPERGNYYHNTSNSSYTTITDTDRSFTVDGLIGGVASIYTDNYTLVNDIITDNTATGITVTGFQKVDNGTFANALTDGSNPYIVSNYRGAADNDGEHWYQEDTLGVYYESNLNALSVEFPVVDRVFNIDDAQYLKFDNLDIRGANLILIDMDNSTAVFDSCKFSMASTGIDAYYGSVTVTNSTMEYVHDNGIFLRNTDATTINSNDFNYITYYEGMNNYYHDWNAAIAFEHTKGDLNVRYNTFDTVTIAFQTHWAEDDWYFEYNKIDGYGFTMADVAAIYMGGDWRTDITKSIKGNIILNSDFDRTRIVGDTTATHVGNYPHALYFDYNTNGVVAEDNTIWKTNCAFFFNRNRNNILRNNDIAEGATDLEGFWATDVYWGNLVDGTYVTNNYHTMTGNTFVFGNNSNEVAYLFHESSTYPFTFSSFTINNNTYHDAFTFSGTGNYIARKANNYTLAGSYNLSNIANLSGGFDTNSTFNNLDWNYEDVTGITRDSMIVVVYNFTSSQTSVSIGTSYTYYDLSGSEYTTNVTLPAWGTKILLFKEE
jgi:hypothetical protein